MRLPITAVPNVLPAPPKQAALVRGYTAPRLPRAVYAHGVDGKAFQTVMERERRRICLRWLDSANPAIPGQVALAVLDTERWVGGWKVGGGRQVASNRRFLPSRSRAFHPVRGRPL